MSNVDEYVRLIRDEEIPYPERIDAIEALVATGDARVTSVLVEALSSKEKFVRRKAVEVLASCRDARARDALCSASVYDEDEGVRRNAVRALSGFTDEAVLDPLYHAMNDESTLVRAAAAESLKTVRKKRLELGKKSEPRKAVESVAGDRATEERKAPGPSAPPVAPPVPKRGRAAREPSPPVRPPEGTAAPTVVPGEVSKEPAAAKEVERPPVPVYREARGYVPPELARLPALRGLSASEELGWPDLVRCLRMARRPRHMLIALLGLLLVYVGFTAAAKLCGLHESMDDGERFQRSVKCIALAAPCAWLILSWTGIIISRMTALSLAFKPVDVARAMRFCARRLFSFVPCLVVSAMPWLIPVLLIYLAGRLSLLPFGGKAIAIISYPFCLIAGLLAALALTGTLVGLPMMTATICVENTGCSDAVTSAWAFVFSRPWRYFLYWIGSTVHCLVNLAFALGAVYVAHAFIAFGREAARPLNPVQHFFPDASIVGTIKLVILLVFGAYILSHYFTARTGIYLLMRKAVDGVELTEIQEG